MELFLTKTLNGLVPSDSVAEEYIRKLKPGSVVKGTFSKTRNPAFHRKAFALLSMAFEWWEPGEISSKHGRPEKNFDRFRKDLTILAGFYRVDIRLDGSTRIEADSLSFANMDDETFSKVYEAFITVVMQRVVPHLKREEVETAVQRTLDFT
jgi:hypothetical protein